MKNIITYILVFIIGVLFALYYLNNSTNNHEKEQIQVVVNEVKNARKLIVTEATFSEMYNYEMAKEYMFVPYSFDKKVIVSVVANVQVSYDLKQMEVEIDSINKKVIVTRLPEPELFIAPSVSYFDFEQSTFNTFSKEELNSINEKSIAQIKENIEISTLKEKAKTQLINELREVYVTTKLLGWELIDETESKLLFNTFKD
jgi:hypothetical protein